MNIKWLNNENIGHRDMIVNYDLGTISSENIIEYDMTPDQVQEFKILMSDLNNDSSRCITSFRDAVVIDSDVYNLCLSCSDVEYNGQKYMIKWSNQEKIRRLKQQIIKNE